jgi:hypothetical protein
MADDKREAMFAGAAQRLPARRVGQPEDIANAVLFLATTPFATGSTVRLDGRRCHCLRDVMLDHATVRTHDLEGTRAFLEAVPGRAATEGKAPPKRGLRFAIGCQALWPWCHSGGRTTPITGRQLGRPPSRQWATSGLMHCGEPGFCANPVPLQPLPR